MDEAERKYREKLKRQSRTLEEGVREYRRRYGRAPPKGFDAWWRFAKKNEVMMMDEYDVLVEDLEPFWGMEGEELRRRALQVGELPSISVVRIRNGNMSVVNLSPEFRDSEVGARAKGFSLMLEKFAKVVWFLCFFFLQDSFGVLTVVDSSQIWTSPSMQKQRGASLFHGNIVLTPT